MLRILMVLVLTGIGVENLVKGIRGIVEVVLKDKGNAEAGNDKKASDGSTARAANGGNDEAGKLFVAANAVVGDAAALRGLWLRMVNLLVLVLLIMIMLLHLKEQQQVQ
ncbi:hypothetical protein BDCR2A_01758 [Borrelia duttonii CR2A]|uniref:Variable large protein n=1 Tax=Borrelia duttonii CR2A TaxID=1432657 RepID=W6TW34_9SPIR|nr:hypothetical protein BDCR2A_01758 [Borrelia duttonii CR2A]